MHLAVFRRPSHLRPAFADHHRNKFGAVGVDMALDNVERAGERAGAGFSCFEGRGEMAVEDGDALFLSTVSLPGARRHSRGRSPDMEMIENLHARSRQHDARLASDSTSGKGNIGRSFGHPKRDQQAMPVAFTRICVGIASWDRIRLAEAASSDLTRSTSVRSRRPDRFLNSPATITSSTLPMLACMMTVEYGSCTGHMFQAVASRMTMSACLPGVREPTLESSPSVLAPSSVIHPRASLVVTAGVFGIPRPACRERALSRARWHPSAIRATENISADTRDSMSMPNDGRPPAANTRPVIGQPCPCVISFSGVMVKVIPARVKRAICSSVRSFPWTMFVPGPCALSAV